MSLIPFIHRVVSADTGSIRERRLCFFGEPNGPNPEYVSHDHEVDLTAKENTPRDLRAEKNREKAKDLDPRDALKDLRAILKLPGSTERKISALQGFIRRRKNELDIAIDRQRARLNQTHKRMTQAEHGRFKHYIENAQSDIFTAESHLFHLSGGKHGRQTIFGPQSPNDRTNEKRESSRASIDRNIALNKAYKAKEELNLRVQNHASRQVRNYIEESLPTNSPLRGPDGKVHIPGQLQEKMDRSKRMRAASDAAPDGIISRDVLGTSAIADYSDAQILRSVQAKHAADNAAMNQRGRDIEANRAVAENNAYVEQVRALGESVQYPALGKTFAKNPTMMKALNSLHAVHMKLVEDANRGALVAMPQSSQGRIDDMRLAIQAVQALASSPALLAVHQQNIQNNPRPAGYLTALGSQIRSGEVVVEKAVDSTIGAVARTRQAANDYADKLATNSRRYDSDHKKFGSEMSDALNKLADEDDRQSALLESANIQNESGPVLRELSVDMPGTNPYSAITITVPDNLGKFRNNKITYQPNKSPPIDNYSIDTLRNAGIILEPEAMSSGKIGAVNVKFTKPGTYFIESADAFSGARQRKQVEVDPSAEETALVNEAMTNPSVLNKWGKLNNGKTYTYKGETYPVQYYFDANQNKLFAHTAFPTKYQYFNMKTLQWEPAAAPRLRMMKTPPVRAGVVETKTEVASVSSNLDKEEMRKQLNGLIQENEALKKKRQY